MKSKLVIGVLGALGVVISYTRFIQWMMENGVALVAPWREAMTASVFGSGLHWDLFFSLAILIAMAIVDRRRLGTRWTAGAIAAGCVLGVCAGLAIYWIAGADASPNEHGSGNAR